MNARRAAWQALVVVGTMIVTCAALMLVAAHAIRARSGEWAVPMRIGLFGLGATIDASVPRLVRLATHPLGIALLDGRRFRTRAGTLRFARGDGERLVVDCAPCRLRVPGLGDERIAISRVRISVLQRADHLEGTVDAGEAGHRIMGRFGARLDAHGATVDVDLDAAPIASWVGLLGDAIPEARIAAIEGSAAFKAHASLPDATLAVEPTIDGFAVSGLGTELLAGRWPDVRCGPEAQRASVRARTGRGPTSFGTWLPRAVVAAEDQRFMEHPGYDLVELAASWSRNASSSTVERGASTIPQQLARLLYVGSARTSARKLRELLHAVEMERTLGKARMLALYLAVAPWGEGTCGAEAAAHRWFGVSPDALTGAQAVWLAAMLHAPDTEADRWRATGAIDLVRATRIAKALPRTTRATKDRVIAALATMALPAVTHEPTDAVATIVTP